MKNIISLFVIILFTSAICGQKINKKKQMYKIWVTTMDSSTPIKGFLYRADKTGIELIKTPPLDTTTVILVNALDIREIKLRRKGKIGRATWIGAVSGVVTGAMIGLIDGDDESIWPGEGYSKEQKATILAIPLGLAGAGIGAGIGSIKKKLIIEGDVEKYASELKLLKTFIAQD